MALVQGHRWPARHDWPTTAARGLLALSTLPLLTMVVGATLGSEPLTLRKTAGVLVAILGVSMALLTDVATAPEGAWRGDLLMVGAARAHPTVQCM